MKSLADGLPASFTAEHKKLLAFLQENSPIEGETDEEDRILDEIVAAGYAGNFYGLYFVPELGLPIGGLLRVFEARLAGGIYASSAGVLYTLISLFMPHLGPFSVRLILFALSVCSLVCHIFVTAKFYGQKASVPGLSIGLDFVVVVAILVGCLYAQAEWPFAFIAVAWLAFWSPYFLTARRVRATFVIDSRKPL